MFTSEALENSLCVVAVIVDCKLLFPEVDVLLVAFAMTVFDLDILWRRPLAGKLNELQKLQIGACTNSATVQDAIVRCRLHNFRVLPGKIREMGECLLLAQRLLPPPSGNWIHPRNRHGHLRNVAAFAGEAPGELQQIERLAQKAFKGGLNKDNSNMNELFQEMSLARQEEHLKGKKLGYRAQKQIELEQVQLSSWKNFHDKLLGRLDGTYADPEPGEIISFSKLKELLERGFVKHIEYAKYGQHIAVILPHYIDDDTSTEGGERPVVYRRHIVQKMPADGMEDVWKLLHPQLKTITLIETNTIFNQLYPQLKIATVWGMRILLASAIYWVLDNSLSHFMRFRDPDERGWNENLDLNADFVLGPWAESRARYISAEERTGVTFEDFAGQDYVKKELQQVVKVLRDSKDDPTVFVPKGVLLHGPPGTGKTLLARAIAGEAGLPFFSSSGSEFVEMFAGVAAARVKDLFSRARSFAPSIIFIDEIDAIGAKRGGTDIGGGGAEREQGLIQLLTELDGFSTGLSRSRVLVIGATNRIDMLDPALLRKGRFDKILPVGIPSEEGRLAILQVHAKNKAFKSEDEKRSLLEEISKTTHRFSGAELANVLNEAVILATRHDKDYIEKSELEEAIARQGGTFATGQEDVLDATGEARSRLAYREAAVAVLLCCYPCRHNTFLKTDIRRMKTTVNMKYTQPPETIYAKKHDYIDMAIRTCAPRVVEELVFGKDNVSWLSGTYLGEAAAQIDRLLFQTGMTALGQTYYLTTKDILPHLTPKIQALRDEYLRFVLQKCTAALLEYRSALETIADRLMEKSELEAAEIWEIFKKSPRIPQPEVLPVDEYGALMDHGRWGIYGLSLPGRVTFHPGNVGTATFGAPKPIQVQFIHDDAWEVIDKVVEQNKKYSEEMLKTKEGREQLEADYLMHYYYANHEFNLD